METPIGAKDRPGYRTTEFWLSAAALIVGAVLSSGLADDSPVMKVAGVIAMVLSAIGYTVTRTGVKKALILFFVLGLPLADAGCSRGMIRADAIAGLTEDVCERHDKILKGEIKVETLSEEKKASYLRSTELLRRVIKEARAP